MSLVDRLRDRFGKYVLYPRQSQAVTEGRPWADNDLIFPFLAKISQAVVEGRPREATDLFTLGGVGRGARLQGPIQRRFITYPLMPGPTFVHAPGGPYVRRRTGGEYYEKIIL